MSRIDEIERAILDRIAKRITDVTTSQGVPAGYPKLPALPHAFTSSPGFANPERTDFKQVVRRTTLAVVMTFRKKASTESVGSTRSEVLDHMEAIEEALTEADPTLGGLVYDTQLETAYLDEADTGTLAALLAFTVEEHR